ncbi:hypothetical protein H0H92_000479 [Tricholoma furcatifolium]|nr:hypothetical protein H0H92_000479 [Tricholoma furcatifolium]
MPYLPMLALASPMLYGALWLALFVLFILYKRRLDRRRANPHGLPYPPGPRPLPLLGNLFDLARQDEVSVYHRLYEKYGERWKAHRRMFHRQFQQSVAPVHWPIQRKEAHALLRRILHSPQELIEHFRHNAASVIMNVTYGIRIAPKDDRYIAIAEKALAGMAEAANPGAFLVEFIPFRKSLPSALTRMATERLDSEVHSTLRHTPDLAFSPHVSRRAWVPGAGFQRKAREWKAAVYEMRDAPFEAAMHAIQGGTASSNFVSNLVNDLESESTEALEKDLDLIKACAGMSYAAWSSFVLAILLYPEVQVKAQEELDRVLGHSRLPDFSDRIDLPYISAIVKEVLRWSPVAPLGLPHMVTNGDEYNGYFIPAGTAIVGNTWAILHDPNTYPNPSVFNPDRFLDPNPTHPEGLGRGPDFSPLDPLSVTFGYGRRVCPGRFMAEAQLFISIACILSVFNITRKLDERGRPIDVQAAFTSGLIRITPRGDYTRMLIEQATEDSD